MANKTQSIIIDSILGGHSLSSGESAPNQFLGSLSIDPSYPANGYGGSTLLYGYLANPAGAITPIAVTEVSQSLVTNSILWFETNPKDDSLYAYGATGSAYVFAPNRVFTALSDGGSLSNSSGNGLAYYDNYMYFAKNTTIARYGPLDGTPMFDGDYWVGTLGMTQLTDMANYPRTTDGVDLSNHYLYRHSDGRLYIADVVGNQGTLHYIKTKKTTVEGDTNDGSTYSAVTFGYGLWPTVIASLDTNIVIGLYEGNLSSPLPRTNKPAKIAFWDTISQKANQIIWSEFPDDTITAMLNLNGSLKIISGTDGQIGIRVSTYLGASSFLENASFYAYLPGQGAVAGRGSRLLFGSGIPYTNTSLRSCVFALGTIQQGLSEGLFNVMGTSANGNYSSVTALTFQPDSKNKLYAGWSTTDLTYGISRQEGSDFSASSLRNAVFHSKIYKFPKPFKITRIRIPLSAPVISGLIIVPKVWIDQAHSDTQLTTINYANYPNKRVINIQPENLIGEHNFFLEFSWEGTIGISILLPIVIEYELLDY